VAGRASHGISANTRVPPPACVSTQKLPRSADIDGGDDDHTLLVRFAQLHGADLVADGLVAADELAMLVSELEAHLADPATITLYCLLCQAWARRPSAT
jgi:hypothetical protein